MSYHGGRGLVKWCTDDKLCVLQSWSSHANIIADQGFLIPMHKIYQGIEKIRLRTIYEKGYVYSIGSPLCY